MLPPGYERLLLAHAVAVARSDVAPGIRRALGNVDGTRSTLHEYAARHPGARLLHGRGAAYAVGLPQVAFRVVIRHNRHGGAFARLTRDLFFAPTRAPHELDVSRKLAHLGVPTPEVVAYALYPRGGMLQRSDVCSKEISGGRDLAQVLTGEGPAERHKALTAAAELVGIMSRAGARHHDLNAKNILVTPDRAYVLDVDRTALDRDPLAALTGNLARLTRSLRKWRDQFGARVADRDISELEGIARDVVRHS